MEIEKNRKKKSPVKHQLKHQLKTPVKAARENNIRNGKKESMETICVCNIIIVNIYMCVCVYKNIRYILIRMCGRF